jgi:hypothetical protein
MVFAHFSNPTWFSIHENGRFGSPGRRFAKLTGTICFRHHIESINGFPYAYQEGISLFRAD